MELSEGLLVALIGFISGAVGSLIAPWVKWGIEKKKLRYKKRVELINEIKSYIESGEYKREVFKNGASFFRRCVLTRVPIERGLAIRLGLAWWRRRLLFSNDRRHIRRSWNILDHSRKQSQ